MNKLKIHFLNTIWSDAILIEANGKWGFVDTGSMFYYPMIKDYLDDNNIKELDFIFLTHFHSDHYGNIVNIINDFKVNTLYIKKYSGHEGITGSGYESNEDYLIHEKGKYEEILEASKKTNKLIFLDDLPSPYTINFNGIDLELYNTRNNLIHLYDDETSPFYHQNRFSENGNSVPIFINFNNHTIFLGSDCCDSDSSVPVFHQMARRIVKDIYNKYNINHIDVYKSCHHGGGGTNGLELLQLLNSDYCIITNTDRWLDNWNTISNLKEANKKVEICKTDYYQYVFDFSYKKIKVTKIEKESLFLQLKKN